MVSNRWVYIHTLYRLNTEPSNMTTDKNTSTKALMTAVEAVIDGMQALIASSKTGQDFLVNGAKIKMMANITNMALTAASLTDTVRQDAIENAQSVLNRFLSDLDEVLSGAEEE